MLNVFALLVLFFKSPGNVYLYIFVLYLKYVWKQAENSCKIFFAATNLLLQRLCTHTHTRAHTHMQTHTHSHSYLLDAAVSISVGDVLLHPRIDMNCHPKNLTDTHTHTQTHTHTHTQVKLRVSGGSEASLSDVIKRDVMHERRPQGLTQNATHILYLFTLDDRKWPRFKLLFF